MDDIRSDVHKDLNVTVALSTFVLLPQYGGNAKGLLMSCLRALYVWDQTLPPKSVLQLKVPLEICSREGVEKLRRCRPRW